MDLKNKRKIGLDIIRSLAVILVLLVHFFLNTNYYNTEIKGWNMIIQSIIRNFCMICVPLFIMLTGYLNEKDNYDKKFFKSLLNIIVIWLFYSILEYLVFNMYNKTFTINIKEFIYNITSFRACSYSWYIEMYIGLYLLTPIFNKAYNLFDNKNKKIIIYVLLFCTTIPQIINESFNSIIHIPQHWINIWPVTYYFIGKYIKNNNIEISFKKSILIILIIQLVIYKYQFIGDINYNNIFVLITSVIIFIMLYKLNIKNKKINSIIKYISIISLDIYLGSSLIDKFIYPIFNNYCIKNNIIQNKVLMYAPIVLLTTFTLSLIYGTIRKKIIKLR